MNFFKKSIFFIITIIIPLLSLANNLHAAELKAYVDQNIVQMGQYIQFNLTMSGQSSSKDPNLSLLHQDFDVLSGMSKSSQTQIINGRMSSSTTWSVTITPKRDGAVIIPPISFEGLQSEAITIVVGKAPAKEFSDAYFETKISSSKVYVQAQLRLDLKLYIKMTNITNTQLDPLTIPNAKVFPIGENRQSEIVNNGIQYYLVEMSYFIYPEQSGELKIPSLRFQGVVTEGSRFSRFGTRRSISANSEAKNISVLGIPANYPKNAQWLPAEQITLTESFNPELNTAIGDPVTRTIITKALGLPAATLPPIKFADIPGLKIYPDQGKTDDKLSATTLTGTRTDSFALIANQAGTIQIDDYKLPWWDTRNNQLRYAEIPGKQLIVSGDGDLTNSQALIDTQAKNNEKIDLALADESSSLFATKGAAITSLLNQQQFLLLLFAFFILWLTTVIGFIVYIRHLKKNGLIAKNEQVDINQAQNENVKLALNAIKQACKNNDFKATRSALIQWGNLQFENTLGTKPIIGLNQLSNLINKTELTEIFNKIDRHLYEDSKEAVELSAFWDTFSSAVKDIEVSNKKSEKGKALSDLYKV